MSPYDSALSGPARYIRTSALTNMQLAWSPSLSSVLFWTAAGAVALRLLRLVDRWRLRTLPGPFALPIVGNLVSIMLSSGGITGWTDGLVKVYGKFYRIWPGGHPIVVLCDADTIRKAAAQSNKRAKLTHYMGGSGEGFEVGTLGVFFMSPEVHGQKFRALRKIFEMALLSPASLEAHEPMLQQCVERLVARLALSADSGEPIDMASAFSDMTVEAIGFAAFGVNLHCQDNINAGSVDLTGSDWVNKPGTMDFGRGLTAAARMVFMTTDTAQGSIWKLIPLFIPDLVGPARILSTWLPDQRMKEEVQARKNINAALRTLIKQWEDYKTAQENKDTSVPLPAMSERGFLAKLLDMAHSENLAENDIMAQMMLAGYETTAALLTAVVYSLMQNPRAVAMLQAEVGSVLRGKRPSAEDLEHMPYLKAVVDETLRLLSPADTVMRDLPQDMKLPDGKVAPGGMDIFLGLRAVHLDPAIWPRADEFLPQRWLPGHEDLAPKRPDAFMPWGLGARMCPGYKFALLEARLCLASLVESYTFSPAPGKPKTEWMSGIVYSANCLWTTVQRRQAGKALNVHAEL